MKKRVLANMSCVIGSASFIALVAVPTQVFAQAAEPAASGPAEGTDEQPAALGEIVVTAQRREQSIQRVPISIQAISGDQVRELGVRTSADIGRIASNVVIQQPGGEGSVANVSIRGIGLNDYSTNNAGPNGLYLDDVYLSTPVAQTFPLFDLDRVEVLKGPQGTLYGRNTSGGAINFITRRPTEEFEGYANFALSSFNTVHLEGAFSGPLSSTVGARLSYNLVQSEGYGDNSYTNRKENGASNQALRLQLLYKPTDRLSLLLSGNYYRTDNRSVRFRHVGTLDPDTFAPCDASRVRAGECVDLFGFGTSPDFYGVSSNRQQPLRGEIYGGSARIDYDLDIIKLTSLSSYIHTSRNYPEDSDAIPARLVELDFVTASDTFTQEIRASFDRGPLSGVIGAYYLGEKLTQTQPLRLLEDIDLYFGPGAGDGVALRSFPSSVQHSYSTAIFGQVDYEILPSLTLTLGGRYSWERKNFLYSRTEFYQDGGIDSFPTGSPLLTSYKKLRDDAGNYRVALNYQATNDLAIYASTATGFKSGGFNGSFLSSDPAEMDRQLEPVRAEHVTAYEIGVKSTFLDRKLLFNLALFYNRYRDMQVFTPILTDPSRPPFNILDNAPRAHTQGIDATLAVSPVEGLTITENLGILDTELDSYSALLAPGAPDYSGNVLALAPKVTSSTVVQYRFDVPSGEVSLLGGADYKSKVYFDTTNDPLASQDGVWLFNARIAYKHSLPHGSIEIAGFGRNLGGKKYLVGSSNLSNPFGLLTDVVGRPREFGVELNFGF